MTKSEKKRYAKLLEAMYNKNIHESRFKYVYHYLCGDENEEVNCEDAVETYLWARKHGEHPACQD